MSVKYNLDDFKGQHLMTNKRVNGICTYPFESLQYTINGNVTPCCWSTKYVLGNMYKDEMVDIWNSERMQDFRKTIYDGSYKFCDLEHCPKLRISTEDNDVPLDDKIIKEKPVVIEQLPKVLELHYDQTCNLKCPTCRTEIINHNSLKHENDEILQNLRPFAEVITFGGVGDPFVSNHIRSFLFSVTYEEISKVKVIGIVTNALLFNKALWENISPAVKSKTLEISISIDAATLETYELNRGGDWNTLLENLQFISSLDFQDVTISMVVQKNNYKEMKDFILIARKFGFLTLFQRLGDWNTFSEKEFRDRNIWSPSHMDHEDFLEVYSDPIFQDDDVFFPRIPTEDPTKDIVRNGYSIQMFNQFSFEETLHINHGHVEYYNWSDMYVDADYEDSVTGHSILITNKGSRQMGGGMHIINDVVDLSKYKYLSLSVQSSSPEATKLRIILLDKNERMKEFLAIKYGFEADGEWHHLKIPLEDSRLIEKFKHMQVDLTSISIPFAFKIPKTSLGTSLKIDNVFFGY